MKKKFLKFTLYWLHNSLLIFWANYIFPSYYVIGSHKIKPFWAVVMSGLLLTFILEIGQPIYKQLNNKFKKYLPLFVFYGLLNFISIWLIARLAPYTGLGISKFYWVLLLALITDSVQFCVWKMGHPKVKK